MGAVPTLVILGASGDLTSRLLLPGLGSLLVTHPERTVRLVGVGRDAMTDQDWRQRIHLALSAAGVTPECLAAIEQTASYVVADVTAPGDLRRLIELTPPDATWYFALPPAVTIGACTRLAGLELPENLFLALEKPFGTDHASARSLNELLRSLVPEERIFRVDHFLGEAMVLNLLGLRFANRIFEPVWNAVNIDRVEILADETLALEGRAGYYDRAGALVDMLQNHLMSIFAMVAMEEPARIEPTELHDLMVHLLRAAHVPDGGSRRARYTAGTIRGRAIPSYVEEEGVDPARGTETYAELTLHVRNSRWAGVPFTLRSGKALAEHRWAIVLHLKPVAHQISGMRDVAVPNVLTLGLDPATITLGITTNGAGSTFALENTRLHADLAGSPVMPYGEVLRCVLDRDHILSVRGDIVEEAWRIIDPVRAAWRGGAVPMEDYPAGSAGPGQA